MGLGINPISGAVVNAVMSVHTELEGTVRLASDLTLLRTSASSEVKK
jgi:hypothetical protein